MLASMLSVALFALAVPQGEVTYPPRPGPREFVLDEAKLLPAAAVAEVRSLCDAALTQKQVPIVVVTIESLAAHGAGSWPIERYAMNLMAEWGIGWPEWNYGMLLLVSPGDRKVRIELGGSWTRRHDDAADRVLRQAVLPQFKQGRFDAGIVAGVKELQAMALRLGAAATAPPAEAAAEPAAEPQRDATPPVRYVPSPPSVPGTGGTSCGLLSLPVVLGILGLVVLSRLGGGRVAPWGGGGGGFYGRRRGGFGSGFGSGLVGGALGSLLYNSMMNHANRGHRGGGFQSDPFGGGGGGGGGGGSFGGGSFGGGFSGGGGATGSW